MGFNDTTQLINERAHSVRIRTWTVTGAIIIALVFYILLQAYLKEEVNLIDFIFLTAVGITIHCIYFADGELFGQKDKTFIQNKKAYNSKATLINKNRKVAELRAYCEYEYMQRYERYINTECGALGLEKAEYEELKKKTPKEIKKITSFEFDGKIIYFTKQNAKRLYKLLFCPIPVERNSADTILSACESNYAKRISDGSIKNKKFVYAYKILIAPLFALFLAFVGYTFQDGFTITKVAKLIVYLTSMFTTATLSFSKGENCQKVYKNKFYVDLACYIDCFFEWLASKNIVIEEEQE